MKITDIKIRLAENGDPQLKAFATMVIDDCFVVKEIRVIRDGDRYFVGMPSRKVHDHCPQCTTKNFLRSRFCHMCGKRLATNRKEPIEFGSKPRYNVDIAHPITSACRGDVERTILEAYLRAEKGQLVEVA